MSGWAMGEVERFETLGSTNAHLIERARQGAPAGLVVVAGHQTAGRGRLGRHWEAPPGASLLLSVLLRPALAPSEVHLCTVALALAGSDACRAVAGTPAGVKWPNDLVVAGTGGRERKLAGVLAETVAGGPPGPDGPTAVVAGIGVNVDWPGPPGAGGTCLAELTGAAVDKDALLDALLEALAPRLAALGSAPGREATVADLASRCVTLGRRVQVTRWDPGPHAPGRAAGADAAAKIVVGTAVGLTGLGHLVVETARGREVMAAGDVVHLRPAPGGSPGAE